MWISLTSLRSPSSSHAASWGVCPLFNFSATGGKCIAAVGILSRYAPVVNLRALPGMMEIGSLGLDRLPVEVLAGPGPRRLKSFDHIAGRDLGVMLVRQLSEVLARLQRTLVLVLHHFLDRGRPTVIDVAQRGQAIQALLELFRAQTGSLEFAVEEGRLVGLGVAAELGHRSQLDRGGELLDQEPVAARMGLFVPEFLGRLFPVNAHDGHSGSHHASSPITAT